MYILRIYRYDDGSDRSRKYTNDKRPLSTIKEIHWSEKFNKRTKGKIWKFDMIVASSLVNLYRTGLLAHKAL